MEVKNYFENILKNKYKRVMEQIDDKFYEGLQYLIKNKAPFGEAQINACLEAM